MANWTDLSGAFGFGTQLTSAQMQQLRDNLTAFTEAASGSPTIVPAVVTPYTSGSNPEASDNRVETTTSATYTKIKEIFVARAGTIQARMRIRTTAGGTDVAYGKIYVNGVAQGSEHSTGSTAYQQYVDDISVSAGDKVQLYMKFAVGTGGGAAGTDGLSIECTDPICAGVSIQ